MKKAFFGIIVAVIGIAVLWMIFGVSSASQAAVVMADLERLHGFENKTTMDNYLASSTAIDTSDFDAAREYFESNHWELTSFQLGAHSSSGRYEYAMGRSTCVVELTSEPDSSLQEDGLTTYTTTVSCN